MKVTKTCPICGSNSDGCCVASAAQFFTLLCKVSNRVSIQEETSPKPIGPTNFSGKIDKLELIIPSGVDRRSIVKQATDNKLLVQAKTLRDRKWYLEVGGANSGFIAYLGHPENNVIRKLICRPSAFDTFREFQEFVTQFIPLEALISADIKRLDFTIDYKVGFQSLLKGLDVKYKQKKIEYTEKSGVRTGFLVGSTNEKTLAYNKSLQSRTSIPTSRIELQVSGKSLPVSKYQDLKNVVGSPDFAAFNHITTNHIEVLKHFSSSDSNEGLRASQLEQLLEREGYYSTRRALNQNKNFKRDYGRHLVVTPWSTQPNQVFQQSMFKYFKEDWDVKK
jgi:hypothetical protein